MSTRLSRRSLGVVGITPWMGEVEGRVGKGCRAVTAVIGTPVGFVEGGGGLLALKANVEVLPANQFGRRVALGCIGAVLKGKM